MSEVDLWSYQMDEVIKEKDGKLQITNSEAEFKLTQHWEAYHLLPLIHDLNSIEDINKNLDIYHNALKWSLKLKQALLVNPIKSITDGYGGARTQREIIQSKNNEIITKLREDIFFLKNAKISIEQNKVAQRTLKISIVALVIAVITLIVTIIQISSLFFLGS